MDIATIGGIVFGFIVVLAAIFYGGNAGGFIDIPSLLIVLGGGAAAVLIRFPIRGVFSALKLGGRAAIRHKQIEPRTIIDEIASLSEVSRREGTLALENVEVKHKFLAKGIRYIADGYEASFIEEAMEKDRDQYIGGLLEGQRVFAAIGDAAPAFGMIGTLVGLVQMLANMSDASQIGPAMAIAILTTLYGAVIANLIALPIAEKLGNKAAMEMANQSLIIHGVMQIREAKSTNAIREMLLSYLPEHHREAKAA